MPKWTPKPIWAGQDAFVIGGGPSLRDFDWKLLVPENTIGCNNAFRLGADVCKVAIFVDHTMIFDGDKPRRGFYDELKQFPNPVVSNDNHRLIVQEDWIRRMDRRGKGLHTDALGYNQCCGASAINLAILLGAHQIYLLGFDMQLDPQGWPNYHDHVYDKPSSETYERMIVSFGWVKRDLDRKFRHVKVFNLNPKSKLDCFPMLDRDEFFRERARQRDHKYAVSGGR